MGDRVGQQLGNYRLVRMIGQGSFADVYLGEHIHLNTQAAIKVLQLRLVGSTTEQFRTEARTVAGLLHPNIVRVLDFGLEDGVPFLVLDYAPNGTLRQRHPRGVPLPPAIVVPYVRQSASALQYAHDRKLIHRDVKPENLLVGREQEVLLSDFGLVLIAQSTGSRSLQEMSGTVAYMAPEQLQGKPRQASDQYSLGIIVYEWLSGNRPFNGTFTELASQHMLIQPPPLYGRIPGISAAVEEVVQIALAKDPHQRFASVQAFATALEQACQKPGQQLFMPSELSSTLSGPTPSHFQQMDPVSLAVEGIAPEAEHRTEVISSGERITSPWDKAIPPRTGPPAHREERQGSPVGKSVLLAALALLIIAGGLGLFYFVNASANGRARADATATAVQATVNAQGALSAHATMTAGAQTTVIANATATVTALQGVYNTIPAFQDTLADNTNGWCQYPLQCQYIGGALHLINDGATGPSYVNAAPQSAGLDFRDFVYQVKMKVLKGFGGGIIFRATGIPGKYDYISLYYYFLVGTDGSYSLFVTDSNSPDRALLTGSTPAIHTGVNQTNLLEVIARGSMLNFYINGQKITTASDNTYSHGTIGILAYDSGHPRNEANPPVEVAFNDARVWTL